MNPVFPPSSNANSREVAPARFAQIRGTLTIEQAPAPTANSNPNTNPRIPPI
jgi:hypothetical protein